MSVRTPCQRAARWTPEHVPKPRSHQDRPRRFAPAEWLPPHQPCKPKFLSAKHRGQCRYPCSSPGLFQHALPSNAQVTTSCPYPELRHVEKLEIRVQRFFSCVSVRPSIHL